MYFMKGAVDRTERRQGAGNTNSKIVNFIVLELNLK